MYAEHVIISKW